MRLSVKLFRPAPNQNIYFPKLWQDPVYGYFETHGKMEFKPNEQYNLTDKEKKAVLWRYRVKEILKKEYLRREFNPEKYKYKEGAVIDPAMFRCYAAEMSQAEFFRATPKSVFLYLGGCLLSIYVYARLAFTPTHKIKDECLDGKILWWDRQQFRQLFIAGNHNLAPTYGLGY